MAHVVFDGKILNSGLLENVQTRVNPNDVKVFEVVAYHYDSSVIVLKRLDTEQKAIDYVNKIGKAMEASEHIPDVLIVDDGK